MAGAATRPLIRTLRKYRSSSVVERGESAVARLRFETGRRARRRAHPDLTLPAPPPVVKELEREGVAVLRQVIDPTRLAAVRAELDDHLKRGEELNRAADDTVRDEGDLAEASVFLSPDTLARGEAVCRSLTNFLSVREPLVSCPATVPLAFDELLLSIAGGYLRCPPAVGGSNLRKSFVNDLPDFDTLRFHSDPNSPKFVKFFFYLNDVDEEGGPFCYVRGSHREKFRGWRAKYRWTPEEIEAHYGTDRVAYMTGHVGDLVMADTTGFHRGTKVQSADRSMLTIDYVVHPEFGGGGPTPQIGASTLRALDGRQQAAADLLDVVPEG